MRPWLSRTLIVVAAFGACWLGALWYWRSTTRMPGTEDVVIWLLLLPLFLLVVLWAGRKVVTAVSARSAAAAAVSAAAATGTAAAPAPGAAQPSALVVLAGALNMPHGETAGALAEALASRQANLQLDPTLQDERGYPILSGRASDVDVQRQQDSMADWLGLHHPEHQLGDEQWRALALGSVVVTELAYALAPHPALPAYLDALDAGKATPPLPTLHLITLLPGEWNEPQRAVAADWLRNIVEQYGWPKAHVVTSLADAGAPPLAMADTLARRAEQAGQPFLCLLLACGSRIGETSVQAWADDFILLDSRHPNGRVPGEGAAGVLLADRAQAALFDASDAALLYPGANAARATSADGRGRTDSTLITQQATGLLASTGIAAGSITLVSADSDARASRVGETLGMANALLPDLDPADQVMTVAAACGDAGAASTLAALVLAQHHVRSGAGAALCVSNLDPIQRSVVLLTPQPIPGPATAPADSTIAAAAAA
jgi:hypothetical protein